MGKGYNNFMSKKAFHPGSYANQKKVCEAEEKAAAKKKHDEETLAQYQKEQELLNQKSLVSRISKDKLSLSFMYDDPTEKQQNDKVEWKGQTPLALPCTSSTSTVTSKAPATTSTTTAALATTTTTGTKTEPKLEWKRTKRVKKEP